MGGSRHFDEFPRWPKNWPTGNNYLITNICKSYKPYKFCVGIEHAHHAIKLNSTAGFYSLFEPFYVYLTKQFRCHSELKAVLPSLAEEIILVTEQLLENLNQSPLTGETKEIIRTQILSLGDPEHRVREIVRKYTCFIYLHPHQHFSGKTGGRRVSHKRIILVEIYLERLYTGVCPA